MTWNREILEIEQQEAKIEHRKLQIKGETKPGESETEEETRTRNQQSTKPNTTKLPKHDFKKFSGELLKWQEFWDSLTQQYASTRHSAQ